MISNPIITKNRIFNDARGSFLKIAHKEFFLNFKKNIKIKQFNISVTKKRGTIRGMHLQKSNFSEIKIVTCLKGKIFDTVVDLRKNKNFGKKKKFILDSPNKSLIVPEGFAHGFQTLTDNCIVIYLHTNYYKKNFEKTLNPLKLGINWPIKKIIISKKDKNGEIIQI